MIRIIANSGNFLVDINGVIKSVTKQEMINFMVENLIEDMRENTIRSVVNEQNLITTAVSINSLTSKVNSVSATYYWIDQPIDVNIKSSGGISGQVSGKFPFIIARISISEEDGTEVYAGVPHPDFIRKNFDWINRKFIGGFDELFGFTSDHAGLPYNTYHSGKICIPKHDPKEIFSSVVQKNLIDYDILKGYLETFLFMSDFNHDLNSNSLYVDYLKEYDEKIKTTSDPVDTRMEYIEKIYHDRNF